MSPHRKASDIALVMQSWFIGIDLGATSSTPVVPLLPRPEAVPDLGHVAMLEQVHLPWPSWESVGPFDDLDIAALDHGVITDLVSAAQLGLLRVEFTGRLEIRFLEHLGSIPDSGRDTE